MTQDEEAKAILKRIQGDKDVENIDITGIKTNMHDGRDYWVIAADIGGFDFEEENETLIGALMEMERALFRYKEANNPWT